MVLLLLLNILLGSRIIKLRSLVNEKNPVGTTSNETKPSTVTLWKGFSTGSCWGSIRVLKSVYSHCLSKLRLESPEVRS